MMRRDGCVGQLQVQSSQAAVPLGFICGSLPVPTVNPSSTPLSPTQAALVPANLNLLSQRTGAPRYRLLPTETDLNTAPSHGIQWDELLPVTASHDASELCNTWEGGYLMQPQARKCESLAVSALTGHGDEIDVVAPVDILKQIFKTPYCKSRLSVAVHRVGHTLILNSGPDIEEGEKIARRKKNQAKATDRNLFSKFVQHSVHDEASEGPDSPKTCGSEGTPRTRRQSPGRQPPGSIPPGFGPLKSGRVPWQVVEDSCSESTSCYSEDDVRPSRATKKGKQRVMSRRNSCEGDLDIQKGKFIREQQQSSKFVPQDPDKPPRQTASENFLRVLFWQFQNLRMLLGSDLLLFSNEKHAAVSLHLMEIERQVTPLMWLDAWLDNVMASIPELAVCYHRNGVVQGYELLKTDDIFLLKGLSEDGTAFFSPHVVQQNASSVLRFLQDNCKQDPGTYWLFKNAGEDLMQLFDLSVISKTRNTCGDKEDEKCGTLPSSRNRGNGHYSLPLAMLLYRLANRLSQSQVAYVRIAVFDKEVVDVLKHANILQDPADRMKCAKIFGKCLEYMDEQEHLVIRASAHEHAARLILACYKQLGVMLQPLLLEDDDNDNDNVTTVKEDVGKSAFQLSPMETNSGLQEESSSEIIVHKLSEEENSDINSSVQDCQEILPDNVVNKDIEKVDDIVDPTPTDLVLANSSILENPSFPHDCDDDGPAIDSEGDLTVADPVPQVVQALADPVSARLAAVHHLSQAIKSLRWQRQLQDVGEKRGSTEHVVPRRNRYPKNYTECVCGEPECVAICDFRDIEVGFGMDEKLWQLLLLLGESYLTLGQAYKEDGQFNRALKAAELACLARGSTPRPDKEIHTEGGSDGADFTGKLSEVHKDRGLFWGQVWVLVGDLFAEIQRSMGDSPASTHLDVTHGEELKMAQEVMKEVKRLKKKVGQFQGNCEICSLTSCSCQSDRASSGISASSSNSLTSARKYARKHARKNNSNIPPSAPDISIQEKVKLGSDADETIITSVAKVMKPLHRDTFSEESAHLDIFTYFGRPVVTDWEKNLSAASECYSSAVGAFVDSVHLREYEGALRKKGWACNELGRRRLAQGNVKSAEAAFETAIVAFRAVKDLPNIVLVYCNLAHGRRAAAEVFASQLSSWEECQLPHFYHAFVKTVAEARFLYQEALEFYGEGRRELMAWGDGIERTMRGLCNEVYTQLAHTYIKLGMLLAREDKFLKANWKAKEQRASSGHELGSDRKSGLSAKEAISKALVLYESLGSLRAQEAAYAQFQLACQQRDSCLFALAVQAEESNTEKRDTRLQGAKRFASMADRYWQKALDHYHAESHPDMFLQILMERSAMCLAMAPASHPNTVLEQALLHLLEGCRAVKFKAMDGGEGRTCHVSPAISTAFTLQLQKLLKMMLGAALSASKPGGCAQTRSRKSGDSSGRNEMSGSPPKASDVEILKKMYRSALKLTGDDDFGVLFGMWYS